jgi:hypothetical protein
MLIGLPGWEIINVKLIIQVANECYVRVVHKLAGKKEIVIQNDIIIIGHFWLIFVSGDDACCFINPVLCGIGAEQTIDER